MVDGPLLRKDTVSLEVCDLKSLRDRVFVADWCERRGEGRRKVVREGRRKVVREGRRKVVREGRRKVVREGRRKVVRGEEEGGKRGEEEEEGDRGLTMAKCTFIHSRNWH